MSSPELTYRTGLALCKRCIWSPIGLLLAATHAAVSCDSCRVVVSIPEFALGWPSRGNAVMT